ncbi:MAG TPA: hypothetical protein VJ547_03720, partial [Candidatus Thermoplasmatota archaeon]|nr:hypothetical protein [Candidatus Thermoplasmatota archaeon]
MTSARATASPIPQRSSRLSRSSKPCCVGSSSDRARVARRPRRVAGDACRARTRTEAAPACARNASTSAPLLAPSMTATGVPGGITASVRLAQMSAPISS